MSVQHANRGIVKKDLQLYYNREFAKSFRGEATSNLANTISIGAQGGSLTVATTYPSFSEDLSAGNYFKNFPNVKIVQGEIPAILKNLHINKISFLHLDMNNGYAEIESIKFFFPKISIGGLILLDDYSYDEMFRDLKNCWDEYAKENNLSILTLPTGQGLIIKI